MYRDEPTQLDIIQSKLSKCIEGQQSTKRKKYKPNRKKTISQEELDSFDQEKLNKELELSNERKKKQELNGILNSIREAVKYSDTYVTISGYYHQENIDEIKRRGFEIVDKTPWFQLDRGYKRYRITIRKNS